MDIITFNTSKNLINSIGGALCRLNESRDHDHQISSDICNDRQIVVSVGGLRDMTKSDSTFLAIDFLDIESASWKANYVITNKARNRAYHGATVVNLHPHEVDTTTDSTGTDTNRGTGVESTVRQKILVFGGGTLSQNTPTLTPCDEILQIEKTIFGYKVTPISINPPEEKVAFLGLTASTIGIKQDRVVLYGGYHPSKGFNNEVKLFNPYDQSIKVIEIDPACSKPPPRAYHSAMIVGNQKQYLLILGGEKEGKIMLSDIWLLDLSDVLQAEYTPEPIQTEVNPKDKSKGGKGGKEPAKVAIYARWQNVVEDGGFLGRSRCNSFYTIHCESEEKCLYDIYLLGGITSEQGLIPLIDIIKGTIIIGSQIKAAPPAKGAPPTPAISIHVTMSSFQPVGPFPTVMKALEDMKNSDGQEGKEEVHSSIRALYQLSAKSMACTVCPLLTSDFHHLTTSSTTAANNNNQLIDQNNNSHSILGWIVTGGLRLLLKATEIVIPSVILILPDGDHPFVKKIKKIIQKNYILEGNPIPQNKKKDHDSNSLKAKRIDYQNGDVYEGQVMQHVGLLELDSPIGHPESSDIGSSHGKSNNIDDNDDEEENEQKGIEGLHFPHGQGKMIYQIGDIYEGEWVEGNRHGQGKLVYQNGDIYEGSFIENQIQGEGVFSSSLHHIEYNGEFYNGVFDGIGELQRKDIGEIFRGHFMEGKKHGDGVLSYVSNDNEKQEEIGEIVGRWEYDNMIGIGKASDYSISSINLLLGYIPKDQLFLDDDQVNSVALKRRQEVISNLTRLSPRSSGSYTGPLVHGQPDGDQGSCIYTSGDQYVGQWRKGRRNGIGRYVFANGDVYEGKWVGDVPCGHGRYQTILGDSYEGQWENNAYHGQGSLSNRKEGTLYMGSFVRGKKQGVGKLFDQATEIILEEGTYMNDRLVKI
eukprot:gene5152-5662_t